MHKPTRKQVLLICGLILLIPASTYAISLKVNGYRGSVFTHPSSLLSIVNKTISPTPSPVTDKLVITRSEDKADHLPALTKTITDEGKIKQLYEDIYVLPSPIPGAKYNCPADFFVRYTLDFYKDNTHVLHAIYDPTGCRTIQLGNQVKMESTGAVTSELMQMLELRSNGFYGYRNAPTQNNLNQI